MPKGEPGSGFVCLTIYDSDIVRELKRIKDREGLTFQFTVQKALVEHFQRRQKEEQSWR